MTTNNFVKSQSVFNSSKGYYFVVKSFVNCLLYEYFYIFVDKNTTQNYLQQKIENLRTVL